MSCFFGYAEIFVNGKLEVLMKMMTIPTSSLFWGGIEERRFIYQNLPNKTKHVKSNSSGNESCFLDGFLPQVPESDIRIRSPMVSKLCMLKRKNTKKNWG